MASLFASLVATTIFRRHVSIVNQVCSVVRSQAKQFYACSKVLDFSVRMIAVGLILHTGTWSGMLKLNVKIELSIVQTCAAKKLEFLARHNTKKRSARLRELFVLSVPKLSSIGTF